MTRLNDQHRRRPVERDRRARAALRRWWGLAAGCTAAAVLVAVASTQVEWPALSAENGAPMFDVDSLARALGLGLDQIHAVGHRYTSANEIFDALQLHRAGSQLGFDGVAARQRLEQLPWVKTATLARVYPDGLAVSIVERQPFAVWRRQGHDLLLDDTGRELGAVGPGQDLGLPSVAGEGAGPLATEIVTIVARYELIAGRVRVARRIAERRWSLELASGGRIELPADGANEALARLVATLPALALTALLDGRVESIDLRAREMVIRRKAPVEPRKLESLKAGPPSRRGTPLATLKSG